jgi:hypothetical protein
MKRQFIKKLATVTVSAAMLAALFSGGINAGIWTAQAQEANVAAVSEQFDTTAPVVESISIDKQGQNVGDDDTFKIAIKAYDSDSGIQDVRMVLESEGNNTTYYYSYADGSLQYNEAAKSYEYAVKVSDAELTDGKVFIDTLTVTDKAGNSSSPVLSSTPDVLNVTASSALYWVNITRSDNEKPVVTSVKLKENGQTVKPGDTLHVTIGATDNSALQDTCYVEFQVNAGNTSHSMYLQWDSANGCYIGSWELPDDIVPGEWYINGINVKDVTGNRAEKNSAWDCKVTVQNDNYVVNEKNAPKFNSISMDKAGQTFTAGDQVKFTADITDDTGVASVKMVLKNVNSELSSKDDVDCYMQNVEGTSKYEYTYTITENDYPCEWYVSSIEARDVYNNMLYASTERQTSGRELPLMYDYYFNVTQNGTFVQPNVNVMFSYINADMEWEIKTIEVPRRTKLSKALEKFDTGVKFDDAKITGWTMVGYPDSDTIVSNNTTFLANYNTNIVEKYVYSYSPDVGSKCLYKETSFVKKGQKIELPTVIPGVKNVKWIKTEELDELIKNGYIINTDTGSYYFEADAEVDDSVPPTDDNNGSTGGNNNQTTTDGNKGNNEGTKLSSDKIQEAVASITTAKAGDTYTVDMSEATVVPKDVLEAAKGKDVDIVLDMNGYKWTINGNNIQADNLKDINLSVDTDSDAIPDDVISELAGNNPVKQISLAYSGDFGFKASLTYNIGSEYAGKYGNLYYYDSTGRMIFQNAGAIDADGNISLNFSHASEYAVVIADYADNSATSSIATGDSSPIVLYAVLCVMAIALAGIAAVTRKKNA